MYIDILTGEQPPGRKGLSLIKAEWRIYASVSYTINGSDNGLSPDRPLSEPMLAGILLIRNLNKISF